jgi:hypothetical protein
MTGEWRRGVGTGIESFPPMSKNASRKRKEKRENE